MSSPQPSDQQGGDQGKPQAPAKVAKVKVGDLVEYKVHDHILGREHSGIGVVGREAGDGATVAVLPLEKRHLEVDPADVTPVSPDEL